jgi:hypothetical protein
MELEQALMKAFEMGMRGGSCNITFQDTFSSMVCEDCAAEGPGADSLGSARECWNKRA